VSRTKILPKVSVTETGQHLLRISEVARRVHISASALRAWEALGLVTPRRSQSRYRLYSESDVRILQRAIFLRRARNLNPAAIVHILKRQGLLSVPAESALQPGQRLRQLRNRRGLSLAQVSKATGISVGFLSAVERGQMRSSVSTLRRIAKVYRTNILSLFQSEGTNTKLVRPGQRKILETTNGVRMELLAWGRTVMEPHLFRVKPGGRSGESYMHEGEEFLYVLKGEFDIWLNGKERYRLRQGDSFYFESSTPHQWSNPGRKVAWLLWINTPPTF